MFLVSCLWKRGGGGGMHVLIYLIILQIYSCFVYVLYNCLFLIHVIDNALAISYCASHANKAHLN